MVEVTFDPRLLPFAVLLDKAHAADCDRQVYTTTDQQLTTARKVAGDRARARPTGFRPDDLKYYLGRTPLAHLPMTALQAARINASLDVDGWQEYLSPAQRELLARIEKAKGKGYPVAIGVEPVTAMKALPQ